MSRGKDLVWRWAEREARETLPLILDVLGFVQLAERMRAIPAIVDQETLAIACHALRGVVDDWKSGMREGSMTWETGALLACALEEMRGPAMDMRRVRNAFEVYSDSVRGIGDTIEANTVMPFGSGLRAFPGDEPN